MASFFQSVFKEINFMHLLNAVDKDSFLMLRGISIDINANHFATLALYTDLMECDLKRYINTKKPDLNMKIKILKQIAHGIQKLTQMNVVNGDLKPENILLDQQQNARISDFGTAKLMHCSMSQSVEEKLIFTPSYSPPELLIDGVKNSKTDVWSFGCIMLSVLGRYTPFTNIPLSKRTEHIKNKEETVIENF